ncbi:FYVE and coiled-coil domain-containing protein 1 [Boleophthalmus pectinirostris]|uniref:FYVE and coiled-coil domain-containing protein 1 n=1 Tax=Boleophthalmus pectinirostris TaxID=150288 RepID=UPI002432B169|nr:FYVE and coiled-coil domain-containing protein 1 [Boleophthalmus pectinirostris]XP_055008083.1 FYVE and coiled-coil domain-containing protein 1 [Boleophthalmus pectinirostris]
MASSSVGDNQLQRIIRDLQEAVVELSKEHRECGEPITDDSPNLHKFFYKLEYLLQFDQKEKSTFLGQRKDYWDYFCECLTKIKGANDGIRFVKSIPELKTSLGKGRAFIRYCLVHQRLADTLQQCLINQRVTSDWYYARSPFLKSYLTADIINHLYELNQIQFDVAARGYDLDADWPSFARRTLGPAGAYSWRPPSRCSSVNSLVSSLSQAQEFGALPDLGQSLLGDLGELGEPCSLAENLRHELDKSELRQQELLAQVQELNQEADKLKSVINDLKGQLQVAQQSVNQNTENHLLNVQEKCELRDRLCAAENRNMELLSKLDEALKEKGQQTASYCNSAWKMQELSDKLKMSEQERTEAKKEAEDKQKHIERLSQELKLKQDELRNCEEKLAQVKAKADSERELALKRLEDLQGAVGRIQGALTLKEKETGNLRAQLQDLQASLESRERQAEELRRRLREEQEEVEQRCDEDLELQIVDLKMTLRTREKELSASSERIKHLEEQLEKLNDETDSHRTTEMPPSEDNIGDYKIQCSNLTEINAKLLLTVKKSEDSLKELSECKANLLEQLAMLKASEKHLKGRLDAANISVEDREKKLLDENLYLEEIVEKIMMQKYELEEQLKRIEHENGEVLEAKSLLAKELAVIRDERDLLAAREAMLARNVNVSQRGNEDLLGKLQVTEDKLKEQTVQCGILQARVVELEGRVAELHSEKGAAESNEKMQKAIMETKDAPFRLVIAEAQLEMNLKEMHRLQEEVVKLRSQLQAGTEEKIKAQALQEVSEASREDLRVLAEQLKGQVEELNRRHVDEILRSREREEALVRERDGEAQARMGLATEVTASRDEMERLKRRYDVLCVENSEAREALHRANTETAELGVHVCMLTAENEEARLRLDGLCSRLEEMEEEADALNATVEQLQEENQELQRNGAHGAGTETREGLEDRLSQARQETEALRAASEEQIQALRFQITSQEINHANQIQTVSQELQEVKLQLDVEYRKAVDLENRLTELEAQNHSYCRQIEEKNIQMAQSQNLIQQKENELIYLKGNLSRSEEAREAAENACKELSENLRRLTQDKKSVDLKTAAELDDLYRTKINLEERLIELIREKDALWQKSDALEFEQKLRDEETERDVNHCISCLSPFSFWLRKYTCRLCGRPFCYYCCSNSVSTQQGGPKERCCLDCYNQHSAVIERHPQEEPVNYSSTPATPLSRLLQAGRAATSLVTGAEPAEKQDDGVFDIITEEEVSGVYDSDSFLTACSSTHGQQGAAELNSSASAGDLTSEDPEDFSATVQDAEIGLLKSGELTVCIPFSLDDIASFGDSYRELFIKSSCYSSLPLSVSSAGPTVSWTFTSEPKSISFSVVYRESPDTPLEQAKVLIPLTRCNSHKETIQGELKVRHPGEYTLIFDNSFSRFISKKVLYHLSVDRPVVYDGSDLL